MRKAELAKDSSAIRDENPAAVGNHGRKQRVGGGGRPVASPTPSAFASRRSQAPRLTQPGAVAVMGVDGMGSNDSFTVAASHGPDRSLCRSAAVVDADEETKGCKRLLSYNLQNNR